MKKIAVIAVLIGISVPLKAQKMAVGYKTGIVAWLNVDGYDFVQKVEDGQTISWNNEVFGRYETKGRWAFEGGIGYNYRPNGRRISSYNDLENGATLNSDYQKKISVLAVNLAAEYKINIPKCVEQFPLIGQITHYIGFNAGPTLINTQTTQETIASNPEYHERYRRVDNYYSIGIGLHHTMVYPISKQLNAIATFGVKYMKSEVSRYSGNTRLGLTIGAAYNL